MFVDLCIIIHFIKKFQQDATVYQNLIILYLYEAQHVSDDTPSIIRSLKLHWQPLLFHTWKVVGRVVGGWKTRGCQCSFRLLMMGGVLPKTCWASYKYGIIKFWYIVASCWNFFMNSEDLFAKRYTMQASNVVYNSFTKIWDTLWTGIARNR
jgi:hypothetical protein